MTNQPASPQPLESAQRVARLLHAIYGPAIGESTHSAIHELIGKRRAVLQQAPAPRPLCERDALLITYADQVNEPATVPLRSLARFCARELGDVLSGVHLLPFFPWSSDDGFSVKDYFAVDPEYGTWEDIEAFRSHFDLMIDAVFNHLSAQSEWFRGFLAADPQFADFFLTMNDQVDLSMVVRPRALPLLTQFQTVQGPQQVWTTFSNDQVDLNIRNPRVLLALLDALLCYVGHGARFIRLDAIAYLCKQPGTSCIHLPETHAVIQLFRAVLDAAAPGVQLITETNVPHQDNISYFGDGTNEAQLVYNFALPPLVLHALLRGDARWLSSWAATLKTPSPQTAFFNFLASHDGIGLNPARGILPDAEIDYLVERCLAHGGFISWKHNPDGSKGPYEMNIVYFDALNDPASPESEEIWTNRFMVAQAIMLALPGVPGIYFHSLFGSRNDRNAALQSGINRRINRQKLDFARLEEELKDPGSLRSRVFGRYRGLLHARRGHPAFSPQAEHRVLNTGQAVFGLVRTSPGRAQVVCLHNLTSCPQQLVVAAPDIVHARRWLNLFSQDSLAQVGDALNVTLRPYEVAWIAAG